MKSNWRIKTIEECLDSVIYTRKIQRKEFLNSGDFPIISQEAEYINGYWNDERDLFKCKNPVVIFGDHTQVIKYIDFDFVMGADGVKILQPNKILNPRFLYYFLRSVELTRLGYARHYRILKNLEIPLPPLSEQKRIVKILDKMFADIAKVKENTEKNLQNSKELFESYLQSVFANPGKDWEERKLIDVCQMNPPKKEVKEKLKNDDFVSFVPMEDMQIMKKEFICNKEKMLKEVIGSYTYFSNNDVLLAKITPCFENGKLGIARNLKNGTGFGSSEYVVFRSNSKVLPDYLYYFLARDAFRKEGAQRMSGAVGHKRVSKEFIEAYILPYPKSISKQKSIVAKLDALSAETKKLEVIYKQKLLDLEELKKSVLKKAFNGEL